MMSAGQGVAIVSGGSRSIGFAVAQALAGHGLQVAVLGRSLAAADAAATQLPGGARGFECDVRDEASVDRVFKAIAQDMGPPRVLVNAAGVNHNALLTWTSAQAMDDVLQTNLRGSILTCRAVCRPMITERRGCIINIGSVVGLGGNVGQAVYSATKAGLVGLTRSLAKELGPRGIRANVVAPGFIDTGMTDALPASRRPRVLEGIPLGRFGDATDVAKAVLFLVEARYITGQVLGVDGGMRL